MRDFRLRLLLAPAAALLAAGCSGGVASDTLEVSALKQSNSAVAIMQVGVAEENCPSAGVTLGRRAGDAFEAVRTVDVSVQPGTWISKGVDNRVARVELPAGAYHVLGWQCISQAGNMVMTSSVGQKEGGFWGIGGSYKKSLGTFTLGAGEVVNVGYLTFIRQGLMSDVISVDVQDLPPRSREVLKQSSPKLAQQMVTRLMTVERKPMPAEALKALCDLLKTVSEATKDGQPLPEKCRAAIAGAAAQAPAAAAATKPGSAAKSTSASPAR